MSTYLGSGDKVLRRTDYRPEWLDRLAEDVTMEASVLNGIVQGATAVREILGHARTLYDYQEFNYVGAYGEGAFAEDYSSRVHGEPIGSLVVVRFNEAGLTQHIVINHRPLKAVLLWARLMGEHFADTAYADYFLTPATVQELLATEAGA
ncbi:hypothetical protein ACIQAC_32530 [Streptomyces sp. NPDC088387]|uniref:hypothetical protein n=1 Tax=Streptomyces sp. NPDC088387 TaxID=3365859 RepID=UPI003810C969